MTSMGFGRSKRRGLHPTMLGAGNITRPDASCTRHGNAAGRRRSRNGAAENEKHPPLRRPAPTEQSRSSGQGAERALVAEPLSRRPPLAAAVRRRLVGNPAVVAAVRHAHHCLAAAEEEIRLSRVPDRPMAFFVIELDQRAALTDRDDVVDQLRLGLEIVFIGGARCERSIAAYRAWL